jgi:hypothetical protein
VPIPKLQLAVFALGADEGVSTRASAYTNFQQCWVGLRFFRDPPGLGFRRFSDTRLGSFIIIIIIIILQ